MDVLNGKRLYFVLIWNTSGRTKLRKASRVVRVNSTEITAVPIGYGAAWTLETV